MPGIGELLILLIIVVPLLIVWLVVRGSRRKTALHQQVAARDWQNRQLFQQAIGQLGDDHAEVRIGAIHTLERLAYESLPLRPAVADTLSGFLGERRKPLPKDLLPQEVPNDVQAAETVLGRMRSWGGW